LTTGSFDFTSGNIPAFSGEKVCNEKERIINKSILNAGKWQPEKLLSGV
jgi:hypothetical protein